MNAQELVTIIPWTFIAQILNLFLQMYLVKRFLFKPINEVLEKRRARAEAQLTDAADAKRSAEEMKATYEKNLAEANAACRSGNQPGKGKSFPGNEERDRWYRYGNRRKSNRKRDQRKGSPEAD